MAADEEMLKLKKPVLRIYGFKPYCLTLGYFMSAEQTLDMNFIKDNNINVTRRITGGKAVLHANEITYSVAAPLSLFGKSIISAYEQISKALQNAFRECGLNVDRTQGKSLSKGPVCFAEKSRYEITYNGKKVAGYAQKKCGDKILQHCSIPFEIDYSLLIKCFKEKHQTQRDLKSKMTCLNENLSCPVNFHDFSRCIVKGFENVLNINFTRYDFTLQEEQNIYNQMQKKYLMPCWLGKR